MNFTVSSSLNLRVFQFDWRVVVSAREAGGTIAGHENADKVRRSLDVSPPFTQPRFLFRFIRPLLGCFRIRDSILTIFSGKVRLLKPPACVLERQTHRSTCYLRRIGPGESGQECLVGWPDKRVPSTFNCQYFPLLNTLHLPLWRWS